MKNIPLAGRGKDAWRSEGLESDYRPYIEVPGRDDGQQQLLIKETCNQTVFINQSLPI